VPTVCLCQRRRGHQGNLCAVDYAELERRLTRLGEALADRLTAEQRSWLAEFLDAGEYGLALEMLADWLSESLRPVLANERIEAELLASAMGNRARVMEPLALCPE
jgi:hypothetical protein